MKSIIFSAVAAVGLVLVGAPAAALADECSRVQPGLDFAQQAWMADRQNLSQDWLDIDGDGDTELVVLQKVPYPAAVDVVLVENDGRGGMVGRTLARFPGPDPWWTYSPLAQVAAGDVDGDGAVDLVVNWVGFLSGSRVQLRLGLGDGKYGELHESYAWLFSSLIGLGDFDGDGRAEPVTWFSGFFGIPSRIHRFIYELDTGLRRAGETLTIDDSISPYAVGDINNDGFDDLVVSGGSYAADRPWVSYGDADLPLIQFRSVRLFPHARGVSNVFPVPNDRLGHDLLLVERVYTPAGYRNAVSLWSHAGGIDYERFGQELLPEGARVPELAKDIDGDGDTDLVSGMRPEGLGLQILIAQADGSFRLAVDDLRTSGFVGLQDVDDDGLLDLLAVRHAALEIQRGGPGPSFGREELAHPADVFAEYARYETGDITEDGLLDLVFHTRPYSWPEIELRRGQGDGSFVTLPSMAAPDLDGALLGLRDVDGDDHLDLVWWTRSSGLDDFSVAYGTGSGKFEPWQTTTVDPAAYRLILIDLGADSAPELLSIRRGSVWSEVEVRVFDFDQRVIVPAGSFTAADNPSDFTIATRGSGGTGSRSLIYGSHGDTATYRIESRSWHPDFGVSASRVLIEDTGVREITDLSTGDFDRDGLTDIAIRQEVYRTSSEPAWSFYRKQPGGSFVLLWQGDDPSRGRPSRLVDIDGDGHQDLVGTESPFAVRRGDGTGRFLDTVGPWFGADWGGKLVDVRSRGVLEWLGLETHPDELWEVAHYSVVSPQVGAPLKKDLAAPEIDFVFQALGDGAWIVASAAHDDCRGASILGRWVDLLPVLAITPVAYLPSETDEILVLEDPASGHRRVVLLGPDLAALEQLWSRASADGGFAIPQNHQMGLVDRFVWGPASGDLPALRTVVGDHRLVQRFAFDGDQLSAAENNHPFLRLKIRALAEDEAGRRREASRQLP